MRQSSADGRVLPAWSVFPELEPPEQSGESVVRVFAAEPRPLPTTERPIELAASVATPIAQTAAGEAVETTVLSFANMNRFGDLLVNYLKARHAVFIDGLGWDLPQTDGMEFDQYDTPICRWVVLHREGLVLAGVRLTPTSARIGMHTYMLRDAQLGLLDSIPTDLLFFDAPVDDRIWEASRLFITDAVSAKDRASVQRQLMTAMARVATAEEATQVIGIVPYVFARWLRRLGMGAVPVGPAFEIDGTKSQAALFNVAKYA
ncbi:MAG: acyl-homoserine-lactone synthase [Paracoccaceae bacterium]